MGAVESKFADIIWENEPISSTELAKKSEAILGWKKTTSFTVLKRLCLKGLFVNEGGAVRSLVSRDEFYSMRSETFVEETFEGSLPAFLTAFTKRKKLRASDVEQIKQMIAEFESEDK